MNYFLDWLPCFFLPGEFIIEITAGQIILCRGNVPGAFLTECREIALRDGLRRGRIIGRREAGQLSLVFSAKILPSSRQRFRNMWNIHGF